MGLQIYPLQKKSVRHTGHLWVTGMALLRGTHISQDVLCIIITFITIEIKIQLVYPVGMYVKHPTNVSNAIHMLK